MAPGDTTFTERQQNIAEALISQMRAIKEENNELRKERDTLAADKDDQAREHKTLTEEIEVLRVHKEENNALQEKISKLEMALDDTQKFWQQSLEGIAQGLEIEISTLLPEPEPESPVFVPASPVDSIISEAASSGLEILEGLGCNRHGDIHDNDGKLLGKVDGKSKSILTRYKRKLVCNRNGEVLYKGAVVAQARLVDTEDGNGIEAEEWGGALPVESSSPVVL